MTRHASVLIAAGALALAGVASPARADVTKDQCVDADSQAQSLRRDGKLSATRQQLLVCVNPACPGVVRDDCTQRLDELNRAQPTIVFDVRDASGNDVTAVKVTVDGSPLADKLDGSALAVDPGSHAFSFAVEGQPAVTKTFVLHEGEKGRNEKIVVGAAPPVAEPQPSTPQPTPMATTSTTTPVVDTTPGTSSRGLGGQKIAGIVIGGVGVAGLVVGAIFGATASSSWSTAQNECTATSCPSASHAQAQSDHDSAASAATISTIGFIAGGALLAGGIILFLTAPSHAPPSTTSATIRVAPSVGPGGGGVWLSGSF